MGHSSVTWAAVNLVEVGSVNRAPPGDDDVADLASVAGLHIVDAEHLWDLLISDKLVANPLKRVLGFDHHLQESDFVSSVILWQILVELNVSSTDSNDNLILLDADNCLCGTNKENIAASLASNDWDSNIQSLYLMLNCSVKFNN